jgi:hypothetical protein
MSKRYYVRDCRSIVGNSVVWWAWNDRGYTCDIRTAKVWTEDEIKGLGRDTDKPYPIEDVLPLAQHHIDIQDLCCKPKRLRSWKMDDLARLTEPKPNKDETCAT